MTDEEMFADIFKLYQPIKLPNLDYKAYYNDSNEIVCFSQEELDMPYYVIPKEWFMVGQTNLFKIYDGQVVRRDVNQKNRLQLRPNGSIFACMHHDIQFAVSESYTGDKAYWDPND
jgi:hypothetical protein